MNTTEKNRLVSQAYLKAKRMINNCELIHFPATLNFTLLFLRKSKSEHEKSEIIKLFRAKFNVDVL